MPFRFGFFFLYLHSFITKIQKSPSRLGKMFRDQYLNSNLSVNWFKSWCPRCRVGHLVSKSIRRIPPIGANFGSIFKSAFLKQKEKVIWFCGFWIPIFFKYLMVMQFCGDLLDLVNRRVIEKVILSLNDVQF